jgi:hypothetical protein
VSLDGDGSDRSVLFEQRSRLADNDFFADPAGTSSATRACSRHAALL